MAEAQEIMHDSSTLALTLDAPGAREALTRCYSLLRKWGREAQEQKATDRGDLPSTTQPVADDADLSQHHIDCSVSVGSGQGVGNE